jgi:hypothetical protein
VFNPYGSQLINSVAAAKRGTRGFAFIDAQTGAGQNVAGQLERSYASPTGSFYARVWFRLQTLSATGYFVPLYLGLTNAPTSTAIEMRWLPGETFTSVCFDNAGNVFSGGSVSAPVGQWHLLELAGENYGAANGRCRAYVNGQVIQNQAVNWTGSGLRTVAIGELFSDLAFQGTLHFDDFRLTQTTPPPSRVFAEGPPAGIASGECAPVSVTLFNSYNATATAAPYTANFNVRIDGAAGQLWSDSNCQNAVGVWPVNTGQSANTAYFLGDGVQHTVELQHPDYRSSPGDLLVRTLPQDAGSDGGSDAGGGGSATDDGGGAGADGGSDGGSSGNSGGGPNPGLETFLLQVGCSAAGLGVGSVVGLLWALAGLRLVLRRRL